MTSKKKEKPWVFLIEKLYLDQELKDSLAQQGKLNADERFNNDVHFQRLERRLLSITN